MNAKRMATAFLIALFISAVCTWLLSRKMGSHSAEHVAQSQYVAPVKPLDAGEVLKPEDLEMVTWPASNPIAGAFTKVSDLVGRAALYPLDKDQPITERLLSASGSGAGLAGRIPAGMRAIALRSDEVMGVAGFLFPGSHVDVLVTYRSGNSPEPVTLTVLQDAEVLAAGQKVQPDPEGKPVTATVVTLLLTPEDAQRAVLASTQGAIHFVLRGGADKQRVKDAPLALSQLAAGSEPSRPAASAIARPAVAIRRAVAPRQIVVETIAGDKASSETFNEVR